MHYSKMAEHVRSKGRGDDTMLVHMTPHEVGGLQALAVAHGGSLTINPHTGLPEAGWLGKLLPTILGGIGMAFGIPPIWMGALGAVGGTAVTGNLKEGLMAGLGAFGGASMAGAAGLGGALGHAGSGLGLSGSGAAVMHPTAAVAEKAAGAAANKAMGQVAAKGLDVTSSAAQKILTNAGQPFTAPSGVLGGFGQAAKAGLPGGIIGKAAPMLAAQGVLGSVAGALTPTPKAAEAAAPSEYGYTGKYTMNRANLQQPTGGAPLATPTDTTATPFNPTNFDSSEKTYFGPTSYTDASGNPWIPGQKTTPNATSTSTKKPVFGLKPGAPLGFQDPFFQNYADGGEVGTDPYAFPIQAVPHPAQQTIDGSYSVQPQQQMQPQPQPSPYMQGSTYGQAQQQQNNPSTMGGIKGLPGLAGGGQVHLRSGSFVMPARETAEFGNGSSEAGQQILARLGGAAIKGGGDGVSDSIQARLDGKQKARVARDEVHFSPEAVARLGGGNHKKGTQKLYALMDKAQKARKSAKRGQDTNLRAVA